MSNLWNTKKDTCLYKQVSYMAFIHFTIFTANGSTNTFTSVFSIDFGTDYKRTADFRLQKEKVLVYL